MDSPAFEDDESPQTYSDYDDASEPARKRPRRTSEAQQPGEQVEQAGSPEPFRFSTEGVDLKEWEHDFWAHHIAVAESRDESDVKRLPLPLSRIKRVMRLDSDVKLIAAEVPWLLAKMSEVFIAELSARSWIESGRRVTLTRADVAAAIKKSDMYDFLCDICPQPEEAGGAKTGKRGSTSAANASAPPTPTFDAHLSAAEAMRQADELLALTTGEGMSMSAQNNPMGAGWPINAMSPSIYVPVTHS